MAKSDTLAKMKKATEEVAKRHSWTPERRLEGRTCAKTGKKLPELSPEEKAEMIARKQPPTMV